MVSGSYFSSLNIFSIIALKILIHPWITIFKSVLEINKSFSMKLTEFKISFDKTKKHCGIKMLRFVRSLMTKLILQKIYFTL